MGCIEKGYTLAVEIDEKEPLNTMKPLSENYFCLILAGGIGSRLWPASRATYPKQFMDFGGTGRTLIQRTYDRFARFIRADHIYISTMASFIPILQDQLPQLPREQILAEPVRRGTLAPITLATTVISDLCPEACIAVSPADQVIYGDDLFMGDILHALDVVAKSPGVINMGVPPTRPEIGYGYVQMGETIDQEQRIYRVKTFTEKPNLNFAQMFMDSGEFLWNTGLFVFGAHYMLHNIIKHVPEYQDVFPSLESYAVLPNLSMEHAVLEHTGHSYVQKCHYGWADVGTWEGIATDMLHAQQNNTPHPPLDIKTDGRGNVSLHSETLFDNATGNIVRLPSGHLAAISGLNDFVVAEENGVLMICPKNDAAAMRRLQTLAHLDVLKE